MQKYQIALRICRKQKLTLVMNTIKQDRYVVLGS